MDNKIIAECLCTHKSVPDSQLLEIIEHCRNMLEVFDLKKGSQYIPYKRNIKEIKGFLTFAHSLLTDRINNNRQLELFP